MRKRLEEELRRRQQERTRDLLADKELYEMADGMAETRRVLSWRARFVKYLDQAGMLMGPGELAGLCLVAGLLAGILAWAAGDAGVISGAVGAAAASLPLLYVALMRMWHQEKLLSQLPEAFDLIARTLRAGQTISHGLQAVAQEFSPPIATEFGYCYDQQNLGLSPEAAMRDLANRSGLLELKTFVLVVVVVHRQTGGNLAELLEKLAGVIRERYRIRGAIKALTAEGRLQGLVLLGLPPAMLVVMLTLNRPYAMVLFQYPLLLTAMCLSMVVGAFWMRKIVHFDF